MFRKIHFRLADKKLLSELAFHFSPLWSSCLGRLSGIIVRYPRTVFSMMLIFMACSLAVLLRDFFTPNQRGKSEASLIINTNNTGSTIGLYDGLKDISATAERMRENLMLRRRVDSLLGKDKLTKADSVWLMKALHQLMP